MIKVPDAVPPHMIGDRLGRRVAVVASPSVRDRVAQLLPWPLVRDLADLPADLDGLIVAGGGDLIDRAKLLRRGRPALRLAAMPTIWGSGAEASPIAVENTAVGKRIHVDPALLPDLIVTAPELGRTVSSERARHACGDAWSHALEAFLSPLATDSLRVDLALLLREMLTLPLAYDHRWYTVSAAACAAQAQSSVGLVHGLAHTLEPVAPAACRSHAVLCSVCLLPVMRFNQQHSAKWSLFEQHAVDEHGAFAVLHALFDRERFAAIQPLIAAHWMTVLRDPCTRTNSALVRPGDLAFFESFVA